MGGICCKRSRPNDLHATANLKSKWYFISTCCIKDDVDIQVCLNCSRHIRRDNIRQHRKKKREDEMKETQQPIRRHSV